MNGFGRHSIAIALIRQVTQVLSTTPERELPDGKYRASADT